MATVTASAAADRAETATRRYRYENPDGTWCEADVTPAVARALERMAWDEWERDVQRRPEKTETDAGLVLNDRPGPKFAFQILYGEGATWDGPDATDAWFSYGRGCRGCGHGPRGGDDVLPWVCLYCTRSSRDHLITRGVARPDPDPKPTKLPAADGLRGGRG